MDLVIVIVAVGLAAGYAAKRAWNLFKPASRSSGCGCGDTSGCGSCPAATLRPKP